MPDYDQPGEYMKAFCKEEYADKLEPPWFPSASGKVRSSADLAVITMQTPYRMLVQAAAFVRR